MIHPGRAGLNSGMLPAVVVGPQTWLRKRKLNPHCWIHVLLIYAPERADFHCTYRPVSVSFVKNKPYRLLNICMCVRACGTDRNSVIYLFRTQKQVKRCPATGTQPESFARLYCFSDPLCAAGGCCVCLDSLTGPSQHAHTQVETNTHHSCGKEWVRSGLGYSHE